MNGKDFSDAMQDNYEQRQRAERDRIPGDGSGITSGGGIGNLSGWLVFAAMIGAILGFITGHDAGSAIFGALFLAALIWVPVAFLKRRADGGASRTAVILWALGGGIAGAILAVAVALVADVAFLKELNVANMIVNYGLLGALGMGGYKLRTR